GAPPLAQRIDDGRRSVFFAHHADYAAATTAERPADVLQSFRRAPHYLLDARLLQAWATALNEAGETQRARYIAQRLREFHNVQSEPFFAPCEAPPKRGATLPFQCLAPTRQFDFEDFR
ncbi:MAG TPA: polymerase, partial [Burkholderiaceae bacterium]